MFTLKWIAQPILKSERRKNMLWLLGLALSLARCTNGVGVGTPDAGMADAAPDAGRPTEGILDASAPDAGASDGAAPPLTAKEFTIPSGSATLYARSIGGSDGGPVLILLHGGPGISSDYLTSLDPLASPDLRLITYDQQGAGRSAATAGFTFTVAEYVADLEAVRGALHASQIHLLGHSWGGMLAMAYAGAHPTEVASIVMMDSTPPTYAEYQAGSMRADARLSQLQTSGIVPNPLPNPNGDDCVPVIKAYLPVYFYDPHFTSPALAGIQCSQKAMDQTEAKISGFNLSPALRTFTPPVLVLFGAADPFGTQWASDIGAAFPAAHPDQKIVPAAGHMPWLEQPGSSFALLRSFLTQRAHLKPGTGTSP